MTKTEYKEKVISTTIESARDTLYKVRDPVRLSKIFFPKNSAKHRRAAFLAIIYEIRNSSYRKATPSKLNMIPKKYKINRHSYSRARAKMKRIGLILQNRGYWVFSDRFFRAWEYLFKYIKAIRDPATDILEESGEMIDIESAKHEDVFKQLRKKERNEV